MDPEGSLPHPQVPATCPYPKLARSSPYLHPTSCQIHINIILPTTSGSPKWALSLRFPHQSPEYLSYSSYALHAPPISFFSILSPEQYWVMSTDH